MVSVHAALLISWPGDEMVARVVVVVAAVEDQVVEQQRHWVE